MVRVLCARRTQDKDPTQDPPFLKGGDSYANRGIHAQATVFAVVVHGSEIPGFARGTLSPITGDSLIKLLAPLAPPT